MALPSYNIFMGWSLFSLWLSRTILSAVLLNILTGCISTWALAQFGAMMQPENAVYYQPQERLTLKDSHNAKLGLNYKKNGEWAVVKDKQ